MDYVTQQARGLVTACAAQGRKFAGQAKTFATEGVNKVMNVVGQRYNRVKQAGNSALKTGQDIQGIIRELHESNLVGNVDRIIEVVRRLFENLEETAPELLEELTSGRLFERAEHQIHGLLVALNTLYKNLDDPQTKADLKQAVQEALVAIRRLNGGCSEERDVDAILHHLHRAIYGGAENRRPIREHELIDTSDMLCKLDDIEQNLMRYLSFLEGTDTEITEKGLQELRKGLKNALMHPIDRESLVEELDDTLPPPLEETLVDIPFNKLKLKAIKQELEGIITELRTINPRNPDQIAALELCLAISNDPLEEGTIEELRANPYLNDRLENLLKERPPFPPIPAHVDQARLQRALREMSADLDDQPTLRRALTILSHPNCNIKHVGKILYQRPNLWRLVGNLFISPANRAEGFLIDVQNIANKQEGALAKPIRALIQSLTTEVQEAITKMLPSAARGLIDPNARPTTFEKVDEPPYITELNRLLTKFREVRSRIGEAEAFADDDRSLISLEEDENGASGSGISDSNSPATALDNAIEGLRQATNGNLSREEIDALIEEAKNLVRPHPGVWENVRTLFEEPLPQGLASWFQWGFEIASKGNYAPVLVLFSRVVISRLKVLQEYLREQIDKAIPAGGRHEDGVKRARLAHNNTAVINDIDKCIQLLTTLGHSGTSVGDCTKVLTAVHRVMSQHPVWIGGIQTIKSTSPMGALALLAFAKPESAEASSSSSHIDAAIESLEIPRGEQHDPFETLEKLQENIQKLVAKRPGEGLSDKTDYTSLLPAKLDHAVNLGAWQSMYEAVMTFLPPMRILETWDLRGLPITFPEIYEAAKRKTGSDSDQVIREEIKEILKQLLSHAKWSFSSCLFRCFFTPIFAITEFAIKRFGQSTYRWVQEQVEKAKKAPNEDHINLQPIKNLTAVGGIIPAAQRAYTDEQHGLLGSIDDHFAKYIDEHSPNNKDSQTIHKEFGESAVDRLMYRISWVKTLNNIENRIIHWASDAEHLPVKIILHLFAFFAWAPLWTFKNFFVRPVQGVINYVIRSIAKKFVRGSGPGKDVITIMIDLMQKNLYGEEQTKTARRVINRTLIDLLNTLSEQIDSPPDEHSNFFDFPISEEAKRSMRTTIRTLLTAMDYRNKDVTTPAQIRDVDQRQICPNRTILENLFDSFKGLTGFSTDDLSVEAAETILTRIYYLLLDKEMLNRQLYIALTSVEEAMIGESSKGKGKELDDADKTEAELLSMLLRKLLMKTVLAMKNPLSDGLAKDQRITDSVRELKQALLDPDTGLIKVWRDQLCNIAGGDDRNYLRTLSTMSKQFEKLQQRIFDRIKQLGDAGSVSSDIHLQDLYHTHELMGRLQNEFFEIQDIYLQNYLQSLQTSGQPLGKEIQTYLTSLEIYLPYISYFLVLEDLEIPDALDFEKIKSIALRLKQVVERLVTLSEPPNNPELIPASLCAHIKNLQIFFTKTLDPYLNTLRKSRSIQRLAEVIEKSPPDSTKLSTSTTKQAIKNIFTPWKAQVDATLPELSDEEKAALNSLLSQLRRGITSKNQEAVTNTYGELLNYLKELAPREQKNRDFKNFAYAIERVTIAAPLSDRDTTIQELLVESAETRDISPSLERVLKHWEDLLEKALPEASREDSHEAKTTHKALFEAIQNLRARIIDREPEEDDKRVRKILTLYGSLRRETRQHLHPVDSILPRLWNLEEANTKVLTDRQEAEERLDTLGDPSDPATINFGRANQLLDEIEQEVSKIKEVTSIPIALEKLPFLGLVQKQLIDILEKRVLGLLDTFVLDKHVFKALVDRVFIAPALEELRTGVNDAELP